MPLTLSMVQIAGQASIAWRHHHRARRGSSFSRDGASSEACYCGGGFKQDCDGKSGADMPCTGNRHIDYRFRNRTGRACGFQSQRHTGYRRVNQCREGVLSAQWPAPQFVPVRGFAQRNGRPGQCPRDAEGPRH